MPEITAEVLEAALTSAEGQAALSAALQGSLPGALQEALQNVGSSMNEAEVLRVVESRVEARLAEERDNLRMDAALVSNRRIELSEMRDKAHGLVEASALHPTLKARLKSKYALTGSGEPSAALDVRAKVNDDGIIEESAMQCLEAAVGEEIKDQLQLQRELSPRSRVSGQGRARLAVVDSGDRLEESEITPEERGQREASLAARRARRGTGSALTDQLLTRAGFSREDLSTIHAAS